MYNIFDPITLKFLTRLRLDLNHLNEHRFRHNFQYCMNSLCSRNLEIEDTSHYLLRCHHFYHQWIDLMSIVKSIYDSFESVSYNNKSDVHLYSDSFFDENKKKLP